VLACLGLSWLVLRAALFRAPKAKTNFRDLIFFPLPPPPLQPNTRQNELSSPAMMEYLAYSSAWMMMMMMMMMM